MVVEPGHVPSLIHNDPKTELEGKFSLQFCVAIALLDGKAGILRFTDEKVLDPKTKAMIKKITVNVDPKIKERSSATLTINLTNGRRNKINISAERRDDAKTDTI